MENGAGIKVVLIDADREHSVPGQSLHATACDGEGLFTIDGLRPATYYAFAFDIVNVESGAIEEAVFVKGLDRRAPTLRLAEGETATLDLKITPWPD